MMRSSIHSSAQCIPTIPRSFKPAIHPAPWCRDERLPRMRENLVLKISWHFLSLHLFVAVFICFIGLISTLSFLAGFATFATTRSISVDLPLHQSSLSVGRPSASPATHFKIQRRFVVLVASQDVQAEVPRTKGLFSVLRTFVSSRFCRVTGSRGESVHPGGRG